MKCFFPKREILNKKDCLILLIMIIKIMTIHKIRCISIKNEFKGDSIQNDPFNIKNLSITEKKNYVHNNSLIQNNSLGMNFILENKIPVIEVSKENKTLNINQKTISPVILEVVPKNNLIKVLPLISEFQKKKLQQIEDGIKDGKIIHHSMMKNKTYNFEKNQEKIFKLKIFNRTKINTDKFSNKTIVNEIRKVLGFNLSEVLRNYTATIINSGLFDINKNIIVNLTNLSNLIDLNLKTKLFIINETTKNKTDNTKDLYENLISKDNSFNQEIIKEGNSIKSSDIENYEIKSILHNIKKKRQPKKRLSNTKNKLQFRIEARQNDENHDSSIHLVNKTESFKNKTDKKEIENYNRSITYTYNALNKSIIIKKKKLSHEKSGLKRKSANSTSISTETTNNKLNDFSKSDSKKNKTIIKTSQRSKMPSKLNDLKLSKDKANPQANETLKTFDIDFRLDIDDIENFEIDKKPGTKSKIKENSLIIKSKNQTERPEELRNSNVLNENTITNKTKELEAAIVKTVNLIEDTEKIDLAKQSEKAKPIDKKNENSLDYMTIQNKKGNNTLTESKIDKKIDSLNKLIENYEILSNFTYSIMKNKEKIWKNTTTTPSVSENEKIINSQSPEQRKEAASKTDVLAGSQMVNSNEVTSQENSDKPDNKPEYKLITLLEEMEKNQDERDRLFIFKIFLLLTFILNLSMFFTWKLSRKNEKFPANLIFSQINCYLTLTILTFIIQTSFKNSSFEKIGFLISIAVNYYSIITNFFYFISVIFLLIIHMNNSSNNELFSVSRISKFEKIINFYHDLIHKVFVLLSIIFYFYFNIPLKNCFIGGCLINNNLKYYLQILPNKIEEILILSCLIVIFFLYISGKRISFFDICFKEIPQNIQEKSKLNVKVEEEEDKHRENYTVHSKNICGSNNNSNNNPNHDNFLEATKNDSLFKKGDHELKYNKYINRTNLTANSFWDDIKIIIIYEILYFVYSLIDSAIRYFKIIKIVDYRYDDYCSIHDYSLVIKSVILFLFLGINSKNISQWKQAFTGEVETDDCDIERKVNEILNTKSKIFNNYMKYKT